MDNFSCTGVFVWLGFGHSDDEDVFVTKPMPISSLPCAICHRPVDLKNCKTDENGQAVHGECLAAKLSQSKSPSKGSPLVR